MSRGITSCHIVRKLSVQQKLAILEDDLNNENYPKNEDVLQNEDEPKNEHDYKREDK